MNRTKTLATTVCGALKRIECVYADLDANVTLDQGQLAFDREHTLLVLVRFVVVVIEERLAGYAGSSRSGLRSTGL